MTDWHGQLFSYCERALDPAFWAEPFNAFSNAAFWIAAIAGLTHWLRNEPNRRHAIDLILIALLLAIGTGSFLFHTFATRWAVLADVIPITIFMLVYLGITLKRFLGWNWFATAAGLAVFFVCLQQAEELKCGGHTCLNGSAGYLPALAALLLVGGVLRARAHPAGPSLISAGVVFAVSLTLRTVDRWACEATSLGITGGPVGTHFLWHILNAVLLLVLLRASIRYGEATSPTARPGAL